MKYGALGTVYEPRKWRAYSARSAEQGRCGVPADTVHDTSWTGSFAWADPLPPMRRAMSGCEVPVRRSAEAQGLLYPLVHAPQVAAAA